MPSAPVWAFLAHHQTHVEWIGCSLHDLIQPSFSFLVGVALPFSIASRTARGQSRGPHDRCMPSGGRWSWSLLGVFLRSIGRGRRPTTRSRTRSPRSAWATRSCSCWGSGPAREQWIALAAILVGYWAAFALYPLPGPEFDYPASACRPTGRTCLSGFAAHWNKNSNLAWAFDRWFLNLFPREEPFAYNGGGYATLSFIPTLGTMILGLIAGRRAAGATGRAVAEASAWLAVARGRRPARRLGPGALGVCPVVKRIWTPSWVLFSGGWCFLFLAGFLRGRSTSSASRRWAFPLVVIGMNSIAAYCMSRADRGLLSRRTSRSTSAPTPSSVLGDPYEPLLHGAAVLLVLWLILFWMYRRRLFLKI